MDSLPQETLDNIVDWAAIVAPKSLGALSLVARRFLERARRHIFQNIYFAAPLKLPPRTCKILHQSRSLLRYVRQVTVVEEFPAYKISQADFRKLLDDLTNLQALDINFVVGSDPERWYKTGLFDIGPRLIYLAITCREDTPLHVFHSLSRLRLLRIEYTPYYSRRQILIPSPNPIPTEAIVGLPWQLTTLHYHPTSASICPLLMSSEVYGQMAHLSLVILRTVHHKFALSTILPACRKSPLKTLRLHYGSENLCDIDVTIPSILAEWHVNNRSIPSFTFLRYLAISLNFDDISRFGTRQRTLMPHHYPDFISTILGSTIQPALELLDLSISWNTRDGILPGDILITHDSSWATLDCVLSDRNLLPRLRAICVTTHITLKNGKQEQSTDESEIGLALREQTLAVLPQIRASGLLVDVGESDTRLAFDRIAKPMYDGAWSYKTFK